MTIDARRIFRQALASRFGLIAYGCIMELYTKSKDLSCDMEFQRKFNGFYRVRRSKIKWMPAFFRLFEELRRGVRPLDFKEILTELYPVEGKVDASFVSKMFHTVDTSLPIIDSNVLKNTGLGEIKGDGDEKIENAVRVYGELQKMVNDYLATEECKRNIVLFDEVLPEYKTISAAKKVDCMLWQG